MKTLTIVMLVIFGSVMTASAQGIAINDPLPHQDLVLDHIDGKQYKLSDFKRKNGLLIVFAANECVAIERWYDRLIKANDLAEANGINVIWVNSNETQRIEGETMEEMRVFAKENKLKYDYLMEREFVLANAFDAQVTPTCYLFDKDLKLKFMGMPDDNMFDVAEVTETYLADALNAYIKGDEIRTKVAHGRGCRIPRPDDGPGGAYIVDIETKDGITLKGTYFNPGVPGPAAILFHQCDGNGRRPWNYVAEELAQRGVHVLTYDYRGHGASEGSNPDWSGMENAAKRWRGVWKEDMITALDFLSSQEGVNTDDMVVAGASCGVFMASEMARTFPERIKAAALLSGPADDLHMKFYKKSDIPILTGVSSEDWSVDKMKEIVIASNNSQSEYVLYKEAGHGTDMFKNSDTLEPKIISWFEKYLITENEENASN